jgi:NADPH:quinone reductase-like Zn-dependent oxidoreductase
MHAARVFEYGPPENMQYVEVEAPEPGPGEVLVRVRGATLSGFDLAFRAGRLKQFPGRPPFVLPWQLGREGAGEVAALGPGVEGWSVGERVVLMTSPACGHCAWCRRGEEALCVVAAQPGQSRFGTQAEYVVYPVSELLRAPDGVPFETLAAAVHNFATAWHGAFTRGRLTAGMDVLVTGCGGGLGSATVVLCRYAGARTIVAVTGDKDKVDRIKALGADHVLNWREVDVVEETRRLTGGGVDLALDNVGGPLFDVCVHAIRLGGTVVVAAEVGGTLVELNLGLVVGKHVGVLGTRSSDRREQETVLSLVGRGVLQPVIADVMPLAEVAEAHRRLENGAGLIGKIVLVP